MPQFAIIMSWVFFFSFLPFFPVFPHSNGLILATANIPPQDVMITGLDVTMELHSFTITICMIFFPTPAFTIRRTPSTYHYIKDASQLPH